MKRQIQPFCPLLPDGFHYLPHYSLNFGVDLKLHSVSIRVHVYLYEIGIPHFIALHFIGLRIYCIFVNCRFEAMLH